MARKRKLNSSQRKFRDAARSANTVCHRETSSKTAFGKCMSREMKKRLGKKKKSARKRRRR